MLGGVAVVFAVLAVVVIVLVVRRPRVDTAAPIPVTASGSATAGTPSRAGTTTTTAEPVTSIAPVGDDGALPRIVVGALESSTPRSAVAAVQRWADDVAAGNTEALTRKCWTFTPERIREMWTGSRRSALLATLTSRGQLANPGGAVWQSATLSVGVNYDELDSSYACPVVTPLNTYLELDDADVGLLVDRYLGRAEGRPVNPADVPSDYHLTCEVGSSPPSTDPGLPNTVVGATITSHHVQSVSLRSGPSDSAVATVDVTAGGRRSQVVIEVVGTLRLPCISAVHR